MLFKIWCLKTDFRKLLISIFKMQTMLFNGIFISKLKIVRPTDLTNINWISLFHVFSSSLSLSLSLSLQFVILWLSQRNKNSKTVKIIVAKEKEKRRNCQPRRKKKKKTKPMGLSLNLMWVLVLVEWFGCNFMICKIGLWEWVEKKGRRRWEENEERDG